MKVHHIVAISIVIFSTGCRGKPEAESTSIATVPVARTSVVTTSAVEPVASRVPQFHINLPAIEKPTPSVEPTDPTDTDLAVRFGTAKRAGPITPEKFAIWKAHEELLLELEVQSGRVSYQQRILELIDDREHSFLIDAEPELRRSGLTLERHMRSFDDLRQKYREKLQAAKQMKGHLTSLLTKWEESHLDPKPFNPSEGVVFMNEPLSEVLTQQQIHSLAGQKITSLRELAMTFWLQRDQLAQLLNITEAEASHIVEQAAKHVSQAELDDLTDLAGRIKKIPSGVDPPDQIGGDQ